MKIVKIQRAKGRFVDQGTVRHLGQPIRIKTQDGRIWQYFEQHTNHKIFKEGMEVSTGGVISEKGKDDEYVPFQSFIFLPGDAKNHAILLKQSPENAI